MLSNVVTFELQVLYTIAQQKNLVHFLMGCGEHMQTMLSVSGCDV